MNEMSLNIKNKTPKHYKNLPERIIKVGRYLAERKGIIYDKIRINVVIIGNDFKVIYSYE